MRREYINYMPGLPVNISLMNIKQHPMHWHNSIEIIFVLEGSLSVTIETQSYIIEEREIEIINYDEAHALKGIGNSNKVLVFHLDPVFFEKYYDDIKNVFFYTSSSVEGAQESEKYYLLRKYLSILLCEFVQQQEGYKENIQETFVELLFHLLNNFHQLIYEEESLKEDEVQFERYDRIVKYIYSNYMNKISLQDIAKREYLSSNYLSNKIKDTMGYNFNDFLNLTRVEESIKLLLDTDKTISEISEEMGFSHIRYFNKHFKKYYKCTPMQFRKKYKVDDEKLEKLKVFNALDIKEGVDTLSIYLEDYDRYNYDDKIIKVDIDTSSEGKYIQNEFLQYIYLGDAEQIFHKENMKIIKYIQENIGFKYGILSKLFTSNMNIFENDNNDFIDWSNVKYILNFLLDIDIKPIILIDESFEEFKYPTKILENFILYFSNLIGEYKIQKWKFKISNGVNQTIRDKTINVLENYFEDSIISDGSIIIQNTINPIYDTSYILPYIIQNSISNSIPTLCFKAIDNSNENMNITNELLFGDSGIISNKGIKKPSYYGYYFLSLLGDEIIAIGDGYIATRKDDDIQILLYTYNNEINTLINFEDIKKKRGMKNIAEKNYSINIFNLQHDYRIIKYKLNEKLGSFYNYWLSLGKPQRVSDEELDLIRSSSNPKISFGFSKRSTVHNILSKIHGFGAELIIFKKVQKTP